MDLGGAPVTPGWRKFKALVEKQKQGPVAARLGVGQQMISSIVRRKSRPGPVLRDRIAVEYPEIAAADWYTAEERKSAGLKRTGTDG